MPQKYRFLPWTRQGLLAAIDSPDTFGANDQPGVISFQAKLFVEEISDLQPIAIQLQGPGDITKIDFRQIVRPSPRPGVTGYKPNLFAFIDFDRPDFPWLFTPASAGTGTRNISDDPSNPIFVPVRGLRPWLVLVVVPRDECTLILDRQPVPVLSITKNIDSSLPNLRDSCLWAHTQVMVMNDENVTGEELRKELGASSDRVISRLICPTLMQPNKSYIACLTPSFKAGRLTGLGAPLTSEDAASLAPAWSDPKTTPFEIPLFYHWEFSTGELPDFETLVRRLEGRPLPPQVGRRIMRVQDSRLADHFFDLGLEGALRTVDMGIENWPTVPNSNNLRTKVGTELAGLIENHGSAQNPLLTLPFYGKPYIPDYIEKLRPTSEIWVDTLNLDPRLRAAAAFGTRVVREHQEELMHALWTLAGELENVNKLLRQAQFAWSISRRIIDQIQYLPIDEFYLLTAPLHARIMIDKSIADVGSGEGMTQRGYQRSVACNLPLAAVTTTFRKIIRPRGPIRRRMDRFRESTESSSIIIRLNDGVIRAAKTRNDPDGMIRFEAMPGPSSTSSPILTPTPTPTPRHVVPIPRLTPESVPRRSFPRPRRNMKSWRLLGADREITKSQQSMNAGNSELTEQCRPVPFKLVKDTLLEQLNPHKTIARWIQARIKLGKFYSTVRKKLENDEIDALEPIILEPELTRPMYEPLRDISQELLLPGLEFVPPNTVSLLVANARFIEAYMVGVNQELGREALWRGFPTEARASFLRHFWDKRGAGFLKAGPDIPKLNGWSGTLGDHYRFQQRKMKEDWSIDGSSSPCDEPLVLMIRGELLQRYPDTPIFLAPARWEERADSPEVGNGTISRWKRVPRFDSGSDDADSRSVEFPLFRATLSPDITFFGFGPTPTAREARGRTVPTNVEAPSQAQAGWFVVIQQQATEPHFGLDLDEGQTFPKDALHSAEFAQRTLQLPVRLSIHADDLMRSCPSDEETSSYGP